MIKVLIVEEQRLFRTGLQALMKEVPDLDVVGMADCGQGAIELVQEQNPDVVLMDIHLPKLDGISAAATIKRDSNHVKIVFLTEEVDKELVIRAINVGADGFLLKALYPDTLYQAIRDAHRGQPVLSGEIASVLVDTVREFTMDTKKLLAVRLENRGILLTRRELEIASLFLEGKTNKQIAQHYHLSEGTIKNYISELYLKLGIHNRNEAVAYLNKIVDIW